MNHNKLINLLNRVIGNSGRKLRKIKTFFNKLNYSIEFEELIKGDNFFDLNWTRIICAICFHET